MAASSARCGSSTRSCERHATMRSGRTSRQPRSPISRCRTQSPRTSFVAWPRPIVTAVMGTPVASETARAAACHPAPPALSQKRERLVAAQVERRDLLGAALQPHVRERCSWMGRRDGSRALASRSYGGNDVPSLATAADS